MMTLLFSVFCVLLVQVEPPAEAVQPLESAMTQPADEATSEPANEAGQIEDAAKLIIGDNTVEARRIGVRTLLRIGTQAAMDRLTVILTEPDHGNGAARSAICGALAASETPPKELLNPLVKLAGELKGPALEGVRTALAAYPQAEAQRALCEVARNPSEPADRRVALIETIGRLGEDYSAAGVLASLMQDSDVAVQAAARAAFERMTGVEFEDVPAASDWWRERADLGEMQWLVRSNHRRREELRRLQAERKSLVERLVAAYRDGFVSLPEKDQGARLVAFLKDGVPEVRQLGLDLIAAMVIDQKDVAPEVREAVMTLLSDRNPDIRRRAAVIAGNLRIAGATNVMIEGLKSERNGHVRAAYAGALGRLDDVRAIEPLLECLSSKDRELTVEAVQSLGALARRGHADEVGTTQVATTLEKSFGELPKDDSELREKYLRSMARVGVESFRPIFEREATQGGTAAVRTAAIAGLATYENGGTAEFLMGLLGDDDALVRGAAIQALGRCGNTVAQFQALFERAGAAKEPDGAVRDKAWEAAQSLFGKLSGDARIQIIAGLAGNEDVAVQRRRAALARALKQDRDAVAELSAPRRLQVDAMLGDALLKSGDAAGALTELQAVAQQPGDIPAEVAQDVYRSLARSAMRVGNNDAVAGALSAALKSTPEAERAARASDLRTLMNAELTSRIAAANSGEAIASLYALVEPAAGALASGDEASAIKSSWTAQISARRDALIDSLLDEQTGGTSVATKLEPFDKKVVLGRIHARLSSLKQTTSGPAMDREAALIALARQLAPDWPGYAPGTADEERSKMLDQLISG